MSQLGALSGVREHNEVRSVSNQGYIGGIYFLVALAMVQYTIGIAMIQAYVLPLKRFEHVYAGFANPKFVSLMYALKLMFLYFLITMTGGMTGFIVSSCVLLLWAIALIFVGTIRRCLRFKEENDEDDAAENPDAIPDDEALARKQTVRGRMNRRDDVDKNPWAGSPAPMGPGQLLAIVISTLLLLLNVVTMLLIVYLWEVPEYRLVDIVDMPRVEYQPQLTAKALQFMYAFPGMAQTLQLDVYVKLLTEYCGVTYTRNITDPGEKIELIHDDWIAKYSINMSEYILQDAVEYSSVNDWFTRAINMTYRPSPTSVSDITSPADARTLVFRSAIEVRLWLKGADLSIEKLVGDVSINGNNRYFNSGGVVISRLAPQDYHRFHSPVAGTIISINWIPGSLWSVSADAARSQNDVFYNQRQVVIIDAGAVIGTVAFVAIGATCVGSVVLQNADGSGLSVGQLLDRGDQLGIMQFGGSTVVTVFAADRINFDTDLLYRSRFPVETFVKVNERIGESQQ